MKIAKSLIYSLLLFIFIVAESAWGGSVTMEIVPETIVHGESFTVTYTVTGPMANIDPDLEVLEKDFIIYGKSTSSELTIINGVSNMLTHYSLTLIAKNPGRVILPAIRFSHGMSDEKALDIKEASAAAKDKKSGHAFIEASIDNKTPYVQSQVNYTLKLYYAKTLSNSNITAPQVDNAIVMSLGNDKQYQTKRGQQYYNVLERQYAIFPQKSGTLKITPPIYTGIEQTTTDPLPNSIQSLMLLDGKPIRLRAREIEISVKPIVQGPDNPTWLPAKALSLQEAWSNTDKSYRVGDPITRTIIISATGLAAAQLPDLTLDSIKGVNSYPDKTKTHNSLQGSDVVGQREEKIAYIATSPGKITLPAIQVPWYDVNSHSMRVAALPGKTFLILAANIGSAPSISNASPSDSTNVSSNVNVANEKAWITQQPLWVWLSVLFACAWAVTMAAWWASSQAKPVLPVENANLVETKSVVSARQLRQEIKQACINNNSKKARDTLMKWAKEQWSATAIHNLPTLAEKVGPGPLSEQLRVLDSHLYAPEQKSVPWHGLSLWNAFSSYKPVTAHKERHRSQLPPLYP